MSAAPLRVLIAAEHASKRFGGEAILPYHYFRLLRARGIDAWLIVHERTRAELEALFPDELDRLHFVADTSVQRMFYRVSLWLPRRIAEATLGLANQLLTQFAQRSIVRRLATNRCVLHQPIPVSPRFPSLLSGLGMPLIVGPMNGGMEYPEAFRQAESWLSRAAIAFGRVLSTAGNAVFPGKKHAAAVLVANERTRAALPAGLRGKLYVVPENGVDLAQWQPELGTHSQECSDRFLFMGRLVDWKALDVVLEALTAAAGAQLDVVGDGPMLRVWSDLAAELGLSDRVHFHGWLSQEQCARMLQDACALVLPSVYECGGAVVLEAMAMSKPVIATAWGGPADYLDASCGILVPAASRAALVSGFAEAMLRLMSNPTLSAELGSAGRARLIAHFNWEKKIDFILEIYEAIFADAHAASHS